MKQRGFTLIELMIVVAIIGILAALALPVYQDYATKAKVAEATTVSDEVRKNMIMAAGEGRLTAASNNDSLGLASPGDISTRYVASVEAQGTGAGSGTVTVTMRDTGDEDVDGKTVVFTISCQSFACSTSMSGTVPAKFLLKP